MKLCAVLFFCIVLSGCQLLSQKPIDAQRDSPCFALNESVSTHSDCDISPWIRFWVEASQLDWSTRKAMISQLSPLQNDTDSLKVLLLSHANNTPYQTRLRAQRYAQQLLNKQSGDMADFIRYIVYEPAQQKLELESAITTLSRINASNDVAIEAQKALIEEQAQQIKKILQIEQSIIEQPKDENP